MKTLKSPILLFCGILYFGITSLFVNAQNSWPQRPVKIVVPFAPGGNTDSIARITAERLTQGLGQLFIVENKVGAGGAIAADYVAKSPADGYTLLMAAMPVMAILPIIQVLAGAAALIFSILSIAKICKNWYEQD